MEKYIENQLNVYSKTPAFETKKLTRNNPSGPSSIHKVCLIQTQRTQANAHIFNSTYKR